MGIGNNPDVRGPFYLPSICKKNISAIINMTYNCHVMSVIICTECERLLWVRGFEEWVNRLKG